MNNNINELINEYPDYENIIQNFFLSSSNWNEIFNIEEKDDNLIEKMIKLRIKQIDDDQLQDFLQNILKDKDKWKKKASVFLVNLSVKDIENYFKETSEQKIYNTELLRNILTTLSIISFHQENYTDFDKCFNYFQLINNNEINKHSMKIAHYQGLVLHKKKYYYDAIRFYETALKIADELGEENYKNQIYDCLGNAYREIGSFEQACQYFHLSIERKEKIQDKEGLGISFGEKGILHLMTGELEKALDYFINKYKISQETNDTASQIDMAAQIGNVLRKSGKVEDAIQYYQQSLKLAKKHNNKFGIGYGLLGLAHSYLDIDEYDVYKECMKQFYENFGDTKGFDKLIGKYYKLRALRYEKNKEYESAISNYKKSWIIAQESLSEIEKGLLAENLALLYIKQNNPTEAKQSFINSINYFEKANIRWHITRIQNEFREFNFTDWLIYNFGGFFGKQIIDCINRGETTIKYFSEKKFSSILVFGIKDFENFSNNSAPEDLIETLNTYFSFMEKVVEENNGIVDNFSSDTFVAVFESETTPDCIYAANDMLKKLDEFNKILIERKKSPISCEIGIHSGEIIRGSIGSFSQKRLVVIGETVDIAHKMKELAETYGVSVLISEKTYNLCANNETIKFRQIDKIHIEEKAISTNIYEFCEIDNSALEKG